MKQISVTVVCSLEPLKAHAKHYTDDVVVASTQEAIEEALRQGEHRGFNHGHCEDFSIVIQDVSARIHT